MIFLLRTLTSFFVFSLLVSFFAPLTTVRAEENRTILTPRQTELHTLNRITFGPNRREMDEIARLGVRAYIEQQLNPALIDDSRVEQMLASFDILNMTTTEIFAKYPNPADIIKAVQKQQSGALGEELGTNSPKDRQRIIAEYYKEFGLRRPAQIMSQVQIARILRAAYSEKQLQEVMVDFWSNHFNVYSRKGATRWFIPSYERDVIRKNALGNFRDLLIGTASHPAMLFYLDNFQSVSPNNQTQNRANGSNRLNKNGTLKPRTIKALENRGLTSAEIEKVEARAKRAKTQQNQRGINENYARELMELHTLGVDGGYTQQDIKEVAKAFTGWTIFDPRGYRNSAAKEVLGTENARLMQQAKRLGISPETPSGTFVFVQRFHEIGVKTVLGKKINSGGMQDGLDVIDLLVSNPATAKFIARKLAVKFVSDTPDEAYVNRIANAFHRSNGDIKTTLRALFYDDEFFAAKNYRSKIKTPFELLVSSLHAVNADVKNSQTLVSLLAQMGEPLYGYQAPTGYPDTSEDWVNAGALIERMNFAVLLSANQIPQTKVNLQQFAGKTNDETLQNSISQILFGEVSETTKATLLKQAEMPLKEGTLTYMDNDSVDSDNPEPMAERNRQGGRLKKASGDPQIVKIVSLVLGSPEFQRQ
ncbi:MAG: DUF1800 domain-containing protein [Pyrinomonadaceae bacterium]